MFELVKQDSTTNARLGKITTAHGDIDTPNFMPVGTSGAVKTVSPDELKAAGVQVILSNAYHLCLKPGREVIEACGGLHKFMGWQGPILTDSGGYQVFSLAPLRKIKNDGVEFQSHIDGSRHFLTPEEVVDFQRVLGSDIIMVLDECLHYPCQRDYAERSLKLTLDWAGRSKSYFSKISAGNRTQQLFGIIQGGTYAELRKESAKKTVAIGFDGYAIGGLSVGEPAPLMYEMIDVTIPLLPKEKTRYLMGVGTPSDMLEAVERGTDIFDCVVPTRNGRNGTAFTSKGKIVIRNSKYTKDTSRLDDKCSCFACANYTKAYLHHLFSIDEILGLRLLSLHNLTFYAKLMENIRQSIQQARFSDFKKAFLADYNTTANNADRGGKDD